MNAIQDITNHTYEYHTVYQEVENLQRSRQIAVALYREYSEEIDWISSIVSCPDNEKQQQRFQMYLDREYDEEDEIETIADLQERLDDLLLLIEEQKLEIAEIDDEYEQLLQQIEAIDVG